MRNIISTPMYQQTQQTPQNNPISDILRFVQNGGNPEQELKNRLAQNPAMAQQFSQFMQQNQGKNPWDLFYELASQRGINPAQFGLPPRR